MNAKTLLSYAKSHGNPVIEGDTATFVWEGKKAPVMLSDLTHWSASPQQFTRAAAGIWTASIQLPADAYVEYTLSMDPQDEDARLLDPLNQRKITNGMGKYNNYFSMPGYEATELIRVRGDIPRGTLSQHKIDLKPTFMVGKTRDLWLYQPPVSEAVPLILVYDGRDYLRRAHITKIVDNLIAQQRIRPVALALLQNAGRHRMPEYLGGEALFISLFQTIWPIIQQNLRLVSPDDEPGSYAALGASMGGHIALYTALRFPTLFGNVISQAGAFVFENPQLGFTSLIDQLLAQAAPRTINIWQDIGSFDWLLESNRKMRDLLRIKGFNLTYREYNAGHNYTAWANLLPEALTTMYGI